MGMWVNNSLGLMSLFGPSTYENTTSNDFPRCLAKVSSRSGIEGKVEIPDRQVTGQKPWVSLAAGSVGDESLTAILDTFAIHRVLPRSAVRASPRCLSEIPNLKTDPTLLNQHFNEIPNGVHTE